VRGLNKIYKRKKKQNKKTHFLKRALKLYTKNTGEILKRILSIRGGQKFEGSNSEKRGARFLRIFNWYVLIT